MYDGKKSTAFDIFYSSLEVVKNKLPNEEKAPLDIFKKALENITNNIIIANQPSVENTIIQTIKYFGRRSNDERQTGSPTIQD